jgi:hypothetical protein
VTKLLDKCEDDIRTQVLDLDDDMTNVNITSGVKKLKMPIDVDVAKILFALISVDDTQPKKEEGYREKR